MVDGEIEEMQSPLLKKQNSKGKDLKQKKQEIKKELSQKFDLRASNPIHLERKSLTQGEEEKFEEMKETNVNPIEINSLPKKDPFFLNTGGKSSSATPTSRNKESRAESFMTAQNENNPDSLREPNPLQPIPIVEEKLDESVESEGDPNESAFYMHRSHSVALKSKMNFD